MCSLSAKFCRSGEITFFSSSNRQNHHYIGNSVRKKNNLNLLMINLSMNVDKVKHTVDKYTSKIDNENTLVKFLFKLLDKTFKNTFI